MYAASLPADGLWIVHGPMIASPPEILFNALNVGFVGAVLVLKMPDLLRGPALGTLQAARSGVTSVRSGARERGHLSAPTRRAHPQGAIFAQKRQGCPFTTFLLSDPVRRFPPCGLPAFFKRTIPFVLKGYRIKESSQFGNPPAQVIVFLHSTQPRSSTSQLLADQREHWRDVPPCTLMTRLFAGGCSWDDYPSGRINELPCHQKSQAETLFCHPR